MDALFRQAADWIASCNTLIIHTGAGMGKDSGLPDYRSSNGQWGAIEKEKGKSIFEVMNPSYMAENPKFAWQKHTERLVSFASHSPHLGYHLLHNWVKQFNLSFFVQTSNVDGYFQKANFPEANLRELHGSMHWFQCSSPCSSAIWKNNITPEQLAKQIKEDQFPKCPHCGALARPNIYMFRDQNYLPNRSNAQKELYSRFLHENENSKIVVIEIGSGPHVQSIRQKTRELARKHSAKIIRINPNEFQVKTPHIGLQAGALEALQKIDSFLSY